MKRLNSLFLIAVILTTLSVSCKKDKGNPPVLPPPESITIDFSNFNSGAKGEISTPKGVINTNWKFAADVAGTFKKLIVTNLAVPVTAFRLAKDQTPAYLAEKTWQWSYTVNLLSSTYKTRLVGKIGATDVTWEMYISQEGGFAEFLWFSGTSKIDATSGQWILNHSSDFPEPVLQIDWSKDNSDIYTVKYTYIRNLNDSRQADPFKGSYIEYGKTSNTTFDAFYNVYLYLPALNAFGTVNVEWNSNTNNGRVKSPQYFGNANWFCWDSSHGNIVCQ